jgi:DNA polymerase III alpha subunit
MARFQLTDLRTALECIAFSRSYEKIQPKLVDGSLVVADGRLDTSDGGLRLIADAMFSLEEAADRPRRGGNGKRNVAAGVTDSNGHAGAIGTTYSSSEAGATAPSRCVTIEVRRGRDRAADLDRVVRVYEALQRYPGTDEVEILVRHGTRALSIPLPSRTVGFCEALETTVRDIVGDGIRVAALHGSH